MMSDDDVRWIQRLMHFSQALAQLRDANALAQSRALSKLEEQGMIQAFEFTHELAWKVLKDFLESRGVQNLYGSRDVTRAAFQTGLITDGDTWMAMIESRNLTSHTYDEDTAQRILKSIRQDYVPQFETLERRMESLRMEENL
ncbi:nucleotidyltransferase substrate binding protein [Sulfobacillus sp. hq2]|uniref:nucleotidyltransferase substrate binding protein n=1 Tax=Sulfobacillus TaxID=28033 RepID=UPI001FA8276E|nr:nucleotidyltransferase substrate binding protein [Sulfobacillus sp. hq2]